MSWQLALEKVLDMAPLETNLRRGLQQRAAEIVAVLQRDGYDCELTCRALSTGHLKEFEASMGKHRG
jgi:hypothetical protein